MTLLQKILLLTIILSFTACGENNFDVKENITPPKKESPTPPPPTNAQYVCYPGEKNDSSLCLPLVEAINIVNKIDYVYRDPLTDSTFPESLDPSHYLSPQRFIDIDLQDGLTKISKNFSLNEFLSSEKGRYGILTSHLISSLQSMRDVIDRPIIVTSGFRSPVYNSNISGSAQWSRHMYGDAVDFFIPNIDLSELKNLCLEYDASFYQIYKTHIHCDWRQTKLEDSFYPTSPSVYPKFFWTIANLKESMDVDVIITKKITLEVLNVPCEDHCDELVYDWHVLLPNNHMITSKSPRPKIKKMPGEYTVDVTIGGSINLIKNFRISL